jgi:hypothetical protein
MKFYNIILPITLTLTFLTPQISEADTIADWTLQTSASMNALFARIAAGAGTSVTNIFADIGSGSASGLHASAATVWSSPAGNGSTNAFSSDHWAPRDYYQFAVSTTGFTNNTLASDQTGSGTRLIDFSLQYSFDGSSFSTFGSSFLVLSNGASANNEGRGITTAAWNVSGSVQSVFTEFFDLSSLTALADN